MSNERDTRPPNFPEAFARAVTMSARERRYIAFFPWLLILCLVAPSVIFWLARKHITYIPSKPEAMAVLSSVAVVGGFLGSASVSITGQMQRMVSEYPFSDYLRNLGLFDHFLFWPQFVLLIQIVNIAIAGMFSLIIIIFKIEIHSILLLMTSFSFMLYTFSKTWNLIDLVRIVTWHYEDYKYSLETFGKENLGKI